MCVASTRSPRPSPASFRFWYAPRKFRSMCRIGSCLARVELSTQLVSRCRYFANYPQVIQGALLCVHRCGGHIQMRRGHHSAFLAEHNSKLVRIYCPHSVECAYWRKKNNTAPFDKNKRQAYRIVETKTSQTDKIFIKLRVYTFLRWPMCQSKFSVVHVNIIRFAQRLSRIVAIIDNRKATRNCSSEILPRRKDHNSDAACSNVLQKLDGIRTKWWTTGV